MPTLIASIKLKLPTFAYRRLREGGKYDFEASIFAKLSNQALKTRGHSMTIAKFTPNATLRKFSFATRCMYTWKNLPDEVIAAPSIISF